jgi:biopolymer transport protein ExbB
MLAQVSPSLLQESVGLFDVMQKGGPLMWLILLCSVLGAGVFVERLLYYHRSRMNAAEFLAGTLNLLRRKSYLEALERC